MQWSQWILTYQPANHSFNSLSPWLVQRKDGVLVMVFHTDEDLLVIFAKRLRAMGIPVNHQSVTDGVVMRRILNSGNFDLIPRHISHPIRPDFTYDNIYPSAAAANLSGTWNWSRYRSPAADELIKRAKAAKTARDRATASRALDRVLLEDSPYVLTLSEKHSRFLRRQTCLRQAFEFTKKGKAPLYDMATGSWWYEPVCKSQ